MYRPITATQERKYLLFINLNDCLHSTCCPVQQVASAAFHIVNWATCVRWSATDEFMFCLRCHLLSYCHFRNSVTLCEQAQKAMYGVIRKIRQFNLPISCQFDLFDKVLLPVLIYGCEVWGYENLQVVERIHLKFLNHILQLKSSTPSFMVYGETCRF